MAMTEPYQVMRLEQQSRLRGSTKVLRPGANRHDKEGGMQMTISVKVLHRSLPHFLRWTIVLESR